jgi:hypothetical protein
MKRKNFPDRKKARQEAATTAEPKENRSSGIREKVKQGLLTELEALDKLREVGGSNPKIEAWLLNRMKRLPTPPPGKYHSTKKGGKGYSRQDKIEKEQ